MGVRFDVNVACISASFEPRAGCGHAMSKVAACVDHSVYVQLPHEM